MKPVARLGYTDIDCADPIAQAGFWSRVLGYARWEVLGDPPHYSGIDGPDGTPPGYSYRRLADPEGNESCLILDNGEEP
jgi:hypothetical protein